MTPTGGAMAEIRKGLPEFMVFTFMSAKHQKKTTNTWRSLHQTRLATLLEPRRNREGSRRGLADGDLLQTFCIDVRAVEHGRG